MLGKMFIMSLKETRVQEVVSSIPSAEEYMTIIFNSYLLSNCNKVWNEKEAGYESFKKQNFAIVT